MEVFNIHIEFDSEVFKATVENYIKAKKKAYVCVVDANVITMAQKDLKYREIIKNATINTCDGSSIAKLVNKIYGTDYHAYNGPEIFARYTHIPYKQVIIGNTEQIVKEVRKKMHGEKVDDSHIEHMKVPFCKVEEFDYQGIAEEINKNKYDIIWVSLGNPKQEIFMSKLLPHLNQGVMFGIGAALNFWVGDLSLPKFHIGSLRFIWLTRIFQDPVRQIKMNWQIIKDLPAMFKDEKKKAKYKKRHV